MACASLSPLSHGVNRSNASVVLHCYNVVSENDHVRMREGQKVRRNKNLAHGTPLVILFWYAIWLMFQFSVSFLLLKWLGLHNLLSLHKFEYRGTIICYNVKKKNLHFVPKHTVFPQVGFIVFISSSTVLCRGGGWGWGLTCHMTTHSCMSTCQEQKNKQSIQFYGGTRLLRPLWIRLCMYMYIMTRISYRLFPVSLYRLMSFVVILQHSEAYAGWARKIFLCSPRSQ